MTPIPDSLGGILRSIRRSLRRRAFVALGLTGATTVGVILFAAWLLAGPEGWVPGTVLPLLILIVGALSVGACTSWLLLRLRSWSREGSLARQIEQVAHLPDGSVRARVELAREVPQGVSPSLARAGESALLSGLGHEIGRLAGTPARELDRWSRIGSAGTLVALILIVGLLTVTPGRARSAWAGLAQPIALLSPLPLPPLELLPGDASLPRGDPPRVGVRADGRDSVSVHWQAIGDVLRERTLPVVEGRAETSLPELEVQVRYWATSEDGAVTSVGTLTPSDPSLLSDLELDVRYPPYTRLPAESFLGVPAWLLVPEGTAIRISGRLDGEGSEVRLLGGGGRVASEMPVEEGTFSGEWNPVRSDRITWEVRGGREGAQLPQTLDIEVIPDRAPDLVLPIPGADGDLPLSLRLPILVEANDDYGVSVVEIETVRQRPGAEEVRVVDPIPTGELPQVALSPVLDFRDWGLRPGDAILLKARASDNAPVPHVVETGTVRLSIPGESELREAALGTLQSVTSRTRELLERVSRETASLRDLARESRMGSGQDRSAGDEADAFQDREELRQALERQSELAASLDELERELEEVSRALAEMAQASEENAELQARIEALEQGLEDILDPGAREQLAEMEEALRQGELEAPPEELIEELAARQEALQERLEQALEELRRGALEEALSAAEDDLRELVARQEEVVDQLGQGEGEEAQRRLAEDTQELEERLAGVEEELSSSPNDSDAGSQTEAARRELAGAREEMTAAAESAEAGDREDATAEANEAREALESALEQLQEASSGLAETPEEEMRDGLLRAAQNSLALARRQGEVRSDLERGFSVDRQEMEGEEAAIREGLENLRSELEAAADGTPDLAEDLAEALTRGRGAVETAIDELRRGSGSRAAAEAYADSAQAAMNRIALLALAAAGDGEQGDQGQSPEEMNEELSALGAEQASLNDEANQLSEQSTPGGAPSPMEMDALTSGQRGVAARLQELARQPGPGGLRGDLDALAEESDDVAERLEQGRLDATTLERQEQLLEHLLAAGRTLERDGPTEEREATSAEPTPTRAVSALPEELLDPRALPLPSTEELGALSPAQRRMVLDYFERVNRRRAGGGEP